MLLEDLKAGMPVDGLIPGIPATVVSAFWHGTDAVEVTYKTTEGALGQQVVFREDQERLRPAITAARPFDALASEFRLAAEAQRISLAGSFDPMLAVATSSVDPLPHQIRAVYGELLTRTPLRFLLADDPGAGKTIMAGLFIKELILRDDAKRVLIVAPGGLVEQWQDELAFKFGLHFDILTNQLIEANVNRNVFDTHPLLIARMDHLARNELIQEQFNDAEWDLVVVDEAHRMSAHYFAHKLSKTRRFQLGERLGDRTRHLLLMTATPHSGSDENFQLFLTLLDRDRFEGRANGHPDTTGLMSRMIKEELKTFAGTDLFPQRIAQTVPYELTAGEQELYEAVTAYVREGMNRADRIGGKRKNTIGFALTVLQRRLASSPEAIYRSLLRRSERLQRRLKDVQDGTFREQTPQTDFSLIDDDEFSSAEIEELEEELLDSATAAQTESELRAELGDLAALTSMAKAVRDAGTDRKWSELSTILQDEALPTTDAGSPRKLIIFTEHRDTLGYLHARIAALTGRPDAVLAIHGGVNRKERRRITEEFTHNPLCQILIATDAAGEGLNLQAAHLMVNYDLPWNPNRIEQRFGRIHRIGQTEVCRLWNLVAVNTREGAVFERLLDKLDQMRAAYGGKVFDVLGEAFTGTPLRELLLQAIQYGDQPDVRARMHQVIDASVGEGLRELLEQRALASAHLGVVDLHALREAMDEARAQRLQPHYIEHAFRAAFARLGGRMARREAGRYEISHVPAPVRSAGFSPIASRYERVTFDLDRVRGDGMPHAEVIAPGHPLHDAVMAMTSDQLADSLQRGTVLVSPDVDAPHLLVGVIYEVVDGTGASVGRRFGYAFVDESGTVAPAGPAPYLDCVAAPDSAAQRVPATMTWLADAEARAMTWMVMHDLPDHLEQVRPRRAAELMKTRALVTDRLEAERDRLVYESAISREKEQSGAKPKESADSLARKAADLEGRLHRRLRLIDKQQLMTTKPPRIVTSAVVLPVAMLKDELPDAVPMHAKETKAIERRGVDLVLATEAALGRMPHEQAFTNKGFDILSTDDGGGTYRIEVKARLAGAEDFFISHTQVLTGKNSAPRYRLALVTVDPRGMEHDQVRYLGDPFASTDLGDFEATGIKGNWPKMWAKGTKPF